MKMPNDLIREEIRKKGVLTFARFMELALYCPETGYYETDRAKVGRGGDFITSVSVGPLFGELLAFQFNQWLEAPDGLPEGVLVEAGAHDGRLAADLLAWFRAHRPERFRQLKYWILEPSLNRRRWQEATLKEFGANVGWAADFAQLAAAAGGEKINGVIFSNELLDAFPVHRYGWDKARAQWFEWGVGVDGDRLVWARLENQDFHPAGAELLAVLPDGYTVETSPAASSWWREAAQRLGQGRLLTIDYGFTTEETFSPSRCHGTVRAYSRHRVSDDLLADPGRQDLTAHVDFSALQAGGEALGLRTESFSTQAKFLTTILARAEAAGALGVWDRARTRQFQTLTHPEHFGRAFRVLVQGR
jgi:SAM-dependent MidA family methyltransferase